MNLSVNSVSPNPNTPNFGMAVKLDENAHRVIKKQVAKMSASTADKFWNDLDAAVERQKDNPVNILIRKCNHRRALAAEVVDDRENALDNKVFAQGLFNPGGLKFVDKAEEYANNVNKLNNKLSRYEKAIDTDYDPRAAELDIEA